MGDAFEAAVSAIPGDLATSWTEDSFTSSSFNWTDDGILWKDSDKDDDESPLDSNLLLNVIYLFVLVATTVIGNIGNVMVIGAVLTDRRLRKECNIFILNLAFADLCVTSKSAY